MLNQGCDKLISKMHMNNCFSRNDSRVILLLMFLFISSPILALNTSETRTINVTTAGKLSTLLPQNERGYVVNLTVTGKLNGSDIIVLQDMASKNMKQLDMSGANIVSGGNNYYTSTIGSYTSSYGTKANVVGEYMFYKTTVLEKVILPNTAVTIESGAFGYGSLKSMTIGPKVTSITAGLCAGTALDEIVLDGNTSFVLQNGILYNKAKTTIYKALRTITGDITLPSTVATIENSSFSECNMRSIIIPSKVTEIETATFSECPNLENVTFPSGLTGLGYDCFGGCPKLKAVDLSGTKVTKVYMSFYNCKSIEEVSFPSTLKEITGSSFTSTVLKKITCAATTPPTLEDATYRSFMYDYIASSCKVFVPKGRVNTYKAATGWKRFSYVYEIGSNPEDNITPTPGSKEINGIYYLFDNATRTATVTYRGTITGSGISTQYDLDFKYYKGDITIPSVVTTGGISYTVKYIGRCAFYKSTLLKSVKMPDTITEIQLSAFYECSGLESVTFGQGLERIKNGAFLGCTSLKSPEFPNSLTYIEDHAFPNCTSITTLRLPSNLTSVPVNTFLGCSALTSVTFGQNLTYIGSGAFRDCKKLSFVSIPSKVEGISYDSFYGCTSLTDINVDAANNTYSSVNGVLLNKAMTILLFCPEGKTGRYDIPSGVQEIGFHGDTFGGFCGCSKLTEISIPSSVSFIGWCAFSGCNALEKLVSYILEPFEFDEYVFSTRINGNYVFSSATLYVPKGTKEKYLATNAWNKFNIIEEMDDEPGSLGSLQEFIDANAGATSVVDVDLSKFENDLVREQTLNVSTGASYRFINGTLVRGVTLDTSLMPTSIEIPVMLISNGSKVEIGKGAVVTGGDYCATETIRLEGGTINITEGIVEGSLGYPSFDYIGDPWQGLAIRLTSSSDRLYLGSGIIYGPIVCEAVGADIQLDKGKIRGMGLRKSDEESTQNSRRKASPLGSREPEILTYSDIYLNSTTSKNYTWGWYEVIIISPDGEIENSKDPFEISLKGESVLHLLSEHKEGFHFNLDTKKDGDVVVVGENYSITEEEVSKMSFEPIYYQTETGYIQRDAYLELKNNKVYLRFKTDELPNTGCDEEWLQQKLDEIASKKPSEPVELTICEDGITLTKNIKIDKDCKVVLTGGPITSETSIDYRYGREGLFMVYGELGFHDINLNFKNDAKGDGSLGYFWSGNGTLELNKETVVFTTNGTVVGGFGKLNVTDAALFAGGEEMIFSPNINTTISDYVQFIGKKTYCNGKISIDGKTDGDNPVFYVNEVYVTSSLDLWAPKNVLQSVYLYKDASVNTYEGGFMEMHITGEWDQMMVGHAFVTSESISQDDYKKMTFMDMPPNLKAEFVPGNHQVRLISPRQIDMQANLSGLAYVSQTAPTTLYLNSDAVNTVYESATINHQNVTFNGMPEGATSRSRLHFTKDQILTISKNGRLTLTDIDITGEDGNEGFEVYGKLIISENVHVSNLPCLLRICTGGSVYASAALRNPIGIQFVNGLTSGNTVIAGTDGYQLTETDLDYITVEGCELQLDKIGNRIIALNGTGIEAIKDIPGTTLQEGIFDLSGRKVVPARQGMYIIKDGDKARKIYVK